METLTKLTMSEQAAALRAQRVSAEALVQEALAKHEQAAELNAIASIDPEGALAEARQCDAELAEGHIRGPLHGLPVTVKDLFATEALPTRGGTAASLPPLGEEAAAVSRLRGAGAIILAKTNMHEVALGLTGENAWTGDVKNPVDPDRQAGGSSSGSAVAVAAGIGLASLGTDTGGSIRAPAALCGVAGFKPSHGLVPLEGALPLSPTCDHAGPLTLDIADARLMTEILAGVALPQERVEAPRLGVPRAYLEGRLTRTLRLEWERMLQELAAAAATLVDVSIEDLELTERAYTPLVRAEAAFVHREALAKEPGGFSPPVRAALESGAAMRAGEYLAALQDRQRVQIGLRRAFEASGLTGLILPATPSEAVRRGQTHVELESGRTLHRNAQLALTAPFSLAGLPVAAVPFGTVNGLPVGLQIVTLWQEDARALSLAEWLERLVRLR